VLVANYLRVILDHRFRGHPRSLVNFATFHLPGANQWAKWPKLLLQMYVYFCILFVIPLGTASTTTMAWGNKQSLSISGLKFDDVQYWSQPVVRA
jgi:hypothetical protein